MQAKALKPPVACVSESLILKKRYFERCPPNFVFTIFTFKVSKNKFKFYIFLSRNVLVSFFTESRNPK